MSHIKKLKSGSPVSVFLPAIISLGIFAFSALLLGPETGIKVLGYVIFIYALISFSFYYLKTRSYIYLISSTYLLAFAFVLLTIQLQYAGNRMLVFPPITRFFAIWMMIFWIWLFYLMVTDKTRWNGNKIMELAAEGVEVSDDAYTERPFPVANIDFSKEEIMALASHLKKNLLCVDYTDGNKIYLVPMNNQEAMQLLLYPNFNVIENTWVAFDTGGQVIVHISRKKYLSFKENLALDQLCNNLGNLFIEFLIDYRKGEGVRIIDKLNTVKSDFFA
ncbi:MAG: hypothetical protein K9H16_11750 [Bacteroidales bacterium]|nr:hypothetical protein [Bacteroidales bacterium]